jgi:hypothetical protein
METATAHISRRCRPFVASAVIASALLCSISARPPAASGTNSAGAQFTQTRTTTHRHSVRPAYGWPVKPFNRQHPVRAYLNDPRNGRGDAKSFHFGIDISAPTGTAVYAVGFSVMQFLLGVDAPVSFLLVRQILVVIVLNTLLALPVHLIIRRWLSPFLPDDPRRRRRRAYTTGGLSPLSRA